MVRNTIVILRTIISKYPVHSRRSTFADAERSCRMVGSEEKEMEGMWFREKRNGGNVVIFNLAGAETK